MEFTFADSAIVLRISGPPAKLGAGSISGTQRAQIAPPGQARRQINRRLAFPERLRIPARGAIGAFSR
jgi:hypothetical protein